MPPLPNTSNETCSKNSEKHRYHLAAYTVVANVISKGLSLLVLCVSVPLTIAYLGAERFGVWMTLASLISFLGFLDFGIGSSLLNEVAQYSVTESRDRLNRLITHALLVLSLIGATIMAILLGAIQVLPLERIFNVSAQTAPTELHAAAQTLAILIGLSVPIVGLQRVYWGRQRAFVYHALVACGNLLSLVLLFVLAARRASISALLLGTYGIQLLATLPLMGLLLREKLFGQFRRAEFAEDAKNLLKNGVVFFVLSVGGAIAWDSDFIIISHVVGAGAVAVYAVAVRLFQLVDLPLQMANAPLWSAYADAYAQNDTNFLHKTLVRAFWLTVVAAAVGVIFLVVFYDPIINFWLRKAVTLSLPLVGVMALWYVIRAAGNAFAMYLNGVRVLVPQMILVCCFCVIALPLKFFGALQNGAVGLVVASMVSYMLTVGIPYLTVYRKVWIAPQRRYD
jgi:O-antigen/teichoic acid export membrane protein